MNVRRLIRHSVLIANLGLLAPCLALAASLDSTFLTSTTGTNVIQLGDTIQFEISIATTPAQDYEYMYIDLTGDIAGTTGVGTADVDHVVVDWKWHYTPAGSARVKFGTTGRRFPEPSLFLGPNRVEREYGWYTGTPKTGDGIPALIGTLTVHADRPGVYDGGGAFPSFGTSPNQTENVVTNSVPFTVLSEATTPELFKVLPTNSTLGTDFGRSIATSGSAAVIGGGPHGAYVYRREGAQWVEESALIATGRTPADGYGSAVAISGDTVLVGANRDSESNVQAGATYVFRKVEGAWIQEAKLLSSDNGIAHWFGTSVAIDGDLVIVGAPKVFNRTPEEAGVAYFFRRTGASWAEEQIIETTGLESTRFGHTLAMSGDRLLVGGGYSDNSRRTVFVFAYDGTTWTEEHSFGLASGHQLFGSAIALDGDTAIIGAPRDGTEAQGSAFVYRFNGSQWLEEQKLEAQFPKESDFFGSSVALRGQRALVGAPNSDSTRQQPGIAYLYGFDGSTWEQEAKFRGSDTVELDAFGATVSFASDKAFVGAIADGTSDFATAYGALYVIDAGVETTAVPSIGTRSLSLLMLLIALVGWSRVRS